MLIPFHPNHIARLEAAGQRIKSSKSRVGWSLYEVVQWMEARKAERFEVAELLKDPDACIRNEVRKWHGGKLRRVMRPGDDLDGAIEWLVMEMKRTFEIDSGGPTASSENAAKLLVRAGLYEE